MVRRILHTLIRGFCLAFLPLSAQESSQEESLVVSSVEVCYKGKEIVLVGQVVVQHGLGQISARRLTIQSLPGKDKKHKFAFLKIEGNVHIELQRGGGELDCQEAEVDYAKLQGFFWGDVHSPDVVYCYGGEKKEGKSNSAHLLEVRSRQMTLDLMRGPAHAMTAARTLVKQIEALQDVRVHYNQAYFLVADRANYQRFATPDSPSTAGLLTLSMQTEEHPVCQLTTQNGDYMQARTIQVDTVQQCLKLDQAQGKLSIRRENQPEQVVEFTADEVMWNERAQMIILKGNEENHQQVYIDEALGEMYADRVVIHYQWENQQFVPSKMILEGHVRLLNRFDGHLQESSSVLHYALADQVNYDPKVQEMLLTSQKGNRVLFVDKTHNMQMSAPSLRVRRDATTQKESIQGVGDVRFTFIEREREQIKQHFQDEEFQQ